MRLRQYLTASVLSLAFSALLFLAGCGGSGGLLADGGIIGTGSIIGTVPGTVIEAYGENGDYRQTSSELTSSDKHPFSLRLKAGVGYYVVMIINEGTPNELVMPIAFPDDQGQLFARIVLKEQQVLDLGHIPLYLDCQEVLQFEPDEDCNSDEPYVFKHPFVLNEDEGSNNPLREMDADDDGTDDYDDDDHGYGQGQQYSDPQDFDGDRVPNKYDYDDDYTPGPNDEDEDGIDDDEDENPGNIPDDDLSGWDGQSMHQLGQAWQEQHGEYAEQDLDSCSGCHGDDFQGTPASGQVGCYGCHNGPNFDEDAGPGPNDDNGYTWQGWNGQGMHPLGQAWQEEQHEEFAEQDLESCAVCHGEDFRGTALSGQVGCYDCHDGPYSDDD